MDPSYLEVGSSCASLGDKVAGDCTKSDVLTNEFLIPRNKNITKVVNFLHEHSKSCKTHLLLPWTYCSSESNKILVRGEEARPGFRACRFLSLWLFPHCTVVANPLTCFSECEVISFVNVWCEYSRGMMPCSTSCSRVLLCCRQSWRTVRAQRHTGHSWTFTIQRPTLLQQQQCTTTFLNCETCQTTDETELLLFPHARGWTVKPVHRHRHPVHFLYGFLTGVVKSIAHFYNSETRRAIGWELSQNRVNISVWDANAFRESNKAQCGTQRDKRGINIGAAVTITSKTGDGYDARRAEWVVSI